MSNDKDFKVKNGIQPTVYHEGLGTVTSATEGYYLAGASYDSVSFSVSGQETAPQGVVLKTDGTKMYVVGQTGDDVNEYSLSTAWDVSTASYTTNFSVSSQDTTPSGLFFRTDGLKLYVSGRGSDGVYEYDLSIAWDISSASYLQTFSVASQETNPMGVFFKSDGTKMYVIGTASDAVNEYDLSTAWDISTASYSQNFSVVSQDTGATDVSFKSDGTKMYIVGGVSDNIYEYSLSTAWDVSTASYVQSTSVLSAGESPQGLFFKPDGTKAYVVGAVGTSIYQYSTVLYTNTLDLSTGSVFEVTPTSDIQVTLSNPAASGTVSGATLLLDGGVASAYAIAGASYDSVSFSISSYQTSPTSLFFKPDGTKMYTSGNAGDDVDEYTLSTAWDISTASHVQIFGVTSQDTYPAGVFFKPDGLRMYILGRTSSTAYQYTLSTAWDISTASYDSVSFSLSSQGGGKAGFFFKPDGTALFVSSYGTDLVYQYTLSTAWDLSTASYDSVSFSIASQDGVAFGITFKPDGTKMYITGSTNDSVYEYDISTAWDLSTASYNSVNFSVASEDLTPQGVFFKDDGTKMYMVGGTGDNIYQYSTGSEATITYPSIVEWPSGTAPTSPAIGETDVVTFNTRDGGSTYQGVLAIDGAK